MLVYLAFLKNGYFLGTEPGGPLNNVTLLEKLDIRGKINNQARAAPRRRP